MASISWGGDQHTHFEAEQQRLRQEGMFDSDVLIVVKPFAADVAGGMLMSDTPARRLGAARLPIALLERLEPPQLNQPHPILRAQRPAP